MSIHRSLSWSELVSAGPWQHVRKTEATLRQHKADRFFSTVEKKLLTQAVTKPCGQSACVRVCVC